MNWKKTIIITALGSTAILGATDAEINPYTETDTEYILPITQSTTDAGTQKAILSKDLPEVTISKWNNAQFQIAYSDVQAEGSRGFLSTKVTWDGVTQDVEVVPSQDGFEINLILSEKPATNVFSYTIANADNLNFFYQPALTQKEIDEGDFRPENVIGSYAVYHKTFKNHIKGQTNYETGKVVHIYRPLVTDTQAHTVWGELLYSNGLLTVTVPQTFLDAAVYPVTIDPDFGYTSIGGTGETYENVLRFEKGTPATSGTLNSISWYGLAATADHDITGALYTYTSDTDVGGIIKKTDPTTILAGDPASWYAFTLSGASTNVTGGTNYFVAAGGQDTTGLLTGQYDTGDATQAESVAITYDIFPDPPTGEATSDHFNSIYATYTEIVVPRDLPLIF